MITRILPQHQFVDLSLLNKEHLSSTTKTSIILDVGASDGKSSLELKRLCPIAKIFSFEINELFLKKFKEDVINEDIILVERALTGFDLNEVPFFHFDGNWEMGNINGLYTNKHNFEQTYSVKTIHINKLLDTLGIEFIDYLKLDIEGSEYKIFEVIDDRTLGAIGQISLEYHPVPTYSPDNIIKRLNDIMNVQEFTRGPNGDGYIYACR